MNQLQKGAILSYVSLAISNIIVLLYTPFLLRMLGQSEYGLYSLVLTVVSALSLLDCGFGPALVRYIVKYRTEGQENKVPNLLAMFLAIYTLIGIVCSFFGIVLYYNTESLFDKTMTLKELEKAKYMVLLISVYISFSFPFSIFSSVVLAYERFVFLKIVQIMRSLLLPALMIPLLFLGYKSEAMASVLVFSGVLIWILNIIYCYSKIKLRIKFCFWDYALVKELLAFSSLIFLKILFERVFWSAGQFVEGMFFGTVSVAILAIALQMRGYYSGFAEALNSMLLPKMTTMAFGNASKEEFNSFFLKVGRIQTHLLGFVMGIYLLFGKKFIILWAGGDYTQSYYASLIIMIPSFISLVQLQGKISLEAYNFQKYHVYGLIAMNIMLILLTLLFYRMGMENAVATSIGIALLSCDGIWLNYIYRNKLGLKVLSYWKNILFLLIRMAFPFVTFLLVIPYFLSEDNLTNYLLKIFIMVVWYVLCAPFLLNNEEKEYVRLIMCKIFKK